MMEEKKGEYKILFVCLGNICRSPSAEAVMKKLVQDAGLDGRIKIDSAGIIGYHAGEKADPRMRSHAARRGYKLDSVSRPVCTEDFFDFDLNYSRYKSNEYRKVFTNALREYDYHTDLSLWRWGMFASVDYAAPDKSFTASIRSNVSAVTPTPAATRKRPLESLQAIGLSFAFVMSL